MISAFDLPSQILSNEIREVNKDFLVGILEKAENPIFEAMLGSKGFVTKGKRWRLPALYPKAHRIILRLHQ